MWKKFVSIARDKAAEGAGGDGGNVPDLVKAAAGAGGEQKAGAGGDDAAAAAAAAKAAADADAAYWPEGLADTFKGASRKEMLDKFAADINGRPKAPEKADDYKLDLPDTLTTRYGDMKDDPVMPMLRETAHELGLDNKQFSGLFVKLHERMSKAGMIVNVEEQLLALGGDSGDPKERTAAGRKRVNAAVNGVKALVGRNVLSRDEARDLIGIAKTKNGVTGIEKILKLAGGTGVQPGGEGGGPAADLSDPAVQARLMYPNSQKK